MEVRQSELYARWLQDLGGAEKISAAQEATLVRACEADMIATSAMQYLAQISQRESLTSRRAQTAIATFQSATSLLLRGVSILGLERVERRLPDLRDYLAKREP